MPYFLTDQFKQVLQVAQRQDEEDKVDENDETAGKKPKPGEASGGNQAGIYKSLFLKGKVEL